MVMALALFQRGPLTVVVAGYESGHSMVFEFNPIDVDWKRIYTSHPHSQPGKSIQHPSNPHQQARDPCAEACPSSIPWYHATPRLLLHFFGRRHHRQALFIPWAEFQQHGTGPSGTGSNRAFRAAGTPGEIGWSHLRDGGLGLATARVLGQVHERARGVEVAHGRLLRNRVRRDRSGRNVSAGQPQNSIRRRRGPCCFHHPKTSPERLGAKEKQKGHVDTLVGGGVQRWKSQPLGYLLKVNPPPSSDVELRHRSHVLAHLLPHLADGVWVVIGAGSSSMILLAVASIVFPSGSLPVAARALFTLERPLRLP